VQTAARIALPSSVSRDDVDDAVHELGCLLVNAVPASERHPAQIILVTADRRNLVYVIDDPRVDALSIVVQGEDPERYAGALRSRLAGAT
jgi:hypothetical protein